MTRIFTRTALASAAILAAGFAAGVRAQAADMAQLAAAAGVSPAEAATMSLSELAAAKFTRDSADENHQKIADTRVIPVDPARHAQLIASARISPAEAESLTLSQLAASKFNAGSDDDNAQPVAMSSRGPVSVGSHLAYTAGVDPAEAGGMSLTEIAAAKFARDTGDD
jgi:hypothetical protein